MSDAEMNEVMRVLGRIEANIEELQRRANSTDEKLDSLTIDRAKVRGGYAVIATLAAIAAFIGGIITKLFHI
jgi:hypothetical protein